MDVDVDTNDGKHTREKSSVNADERSLAWNSPGISPLPLKPLDQHRAIKARDQKARLNNRPAPTEITLESHEELLGTGLCYQNFREDDPKSTTLSAIDVQR
jgi:hypothetical protein